MYDAVTVTLIIMITALLRWSLLTAPGVHPNAWAGGEEKDLMTLAFVPVDSPHPTRIKQHKR